MASSQRQQGKKKGVGSLFHFPLQQLTVDRQAVLDRTHRLAAGHRQNDPGAAHCWLVPCALSMDRLSLRHMSDLTPILSAIEHGDPHAAEQLLPLVYDELRQMAAQKLAQEQPGQTLQATALVHEG